MSEIVLETKNLGISFGGLKAVSGVNLQIKKGEIYGLIGPNGAGKTTIFNLLTGVYQPTEGTFYLNGRELRKLSQEKINHAGIARTFQNIRLFNNMTVRRNVMVGLHNNPEFKCSMFESMFRLPKHFKCEKKMKERAVEILKIFDLEDEKDSLACNLPYGKQRKLEIARALAQDPTIIILDEATSALDSVTEAKIQRAFDALAKGRTTLIIAECRAFHCNINFARHIHTYTHSTACIAMESRYIVTEQA